MKPIIIDGESLNINDLKGKYPIFDTFKNDFYISWVEPGNEEEVDELDKNFKSVYAKECYQVGSYNFSEYNMNDIKMILLRNLVMDDNKIKTYWKFVDSVTAEIIKKYGDIKIGLNNIFKKFEEKKDFDVHLIFKQYLFQAYKGFFSEYRTKLIIASHPKCREERIFDVYKTDEKGDTKEKIDFLVYVKRAENNSSGFWKKIGNGSKTTKNETEEKCSVVFHGFKCEKCIHIGYGLYVLPKEEIYRVIEEVLALTTF